MKRVPIRDLRSPKEVKPRVFDVLIEPERVLLDVKDSKKGNVLLTAMHKEIAWLFHAIHYSGP